MRRAAPPSIRCRAAATRSRACRSWFWPRSRASVASTWASCARIRARCPCCSAAWASRSAATRSHSSFARARRSAGRGRRLAVASRLGRQFAGRLHGLIHQAGQPVAAALVLGHRPIDLLFGVLQPLDEFRRPRLEPVQQTLAQPLPQARRLQADGQRGRRRPIRRRNDLRRPPAAGASARVPLRRRARRKSASTSSQLW